MVAVQAYLSGKQAYILIVNPFPPSRTLIEVHPLFESFTHPSPRLWKHTHPPRLADWLWALIDNRSSKSPPLWNCSVCRNDGRYHCICQSVLEPALLLFLVLLYFHCTTPSSNLVTAVHDDSNPVEIFIFTRKEISTELDKILPICFCSNPVQSLAELNQVSGWTKKYPMCQWYSPPPRYTISPPSGLNWTTLAKANQAKAQLQTQVEFLRIGENLRQLLLSLLARGKSGWH